MGTTHSAPIPSSARRSDDTDLTVIDFGAPEQPIAKQPFAKQPSAKQPQTKSPPATLAWTAEEAAELQREADALAKVGRHDDYLDNARRILAEGDPRTPAEYREIARLHAKSLGPAGHTESRRLTTALDRAINETESLREPALKSGQTPNVDHEAGTGIEYAMRQENRHGTGGEETDLDQPAIPADSTVPSPDDLMGTGSRYVGDPREENFDWEHSLVTELVNLGVNEDVAEISAFLVAASPIGTVGDVLQGVLNAGLHLEKGDGAAALAELGKTGMSVAKIKKVEKFLNKGGEWVAKALGSAIPKTVASMAVIDLVKQGLPKDVVTEAINRGLSKGFNPSDVLVYGFYSGHAKITVGKAVDKIIGTSQSGLTKAIGKLPTSKQKEIRDFTKKKLIQAGASYLKDVSEEAQSRMIDTVLDEIFDPASHENIPHRVE